VKARRQWIDDEQWFCAVLVCVGLWRKLGLTLASTETRSSGSVVLHGNLLLMIVWFRGHSSRMIFV